MSQPLEPAIAIADALVAALNAQAFSRTFTAAREYVARRDLVSSSTLAATVLLADLESEIDTRRDDKETHTIVVVIHQKVADLEVATLDPLLRLTREVHNFLRNLAPAGARVMRRKMKPRYDLEALQSQRQFISFLSVECNLIYNPEDAA